MDVNQSSPVTIGTYFMRWWRALPARRKGRWWLGLGTFATFWIAGAVGAPAAVAGIGRMDGAARLIMALGMGGFSFLWRFLKGQDLIRETAAQPNLFWLPLALLVPGIIYLFFYILSRPPNPLYGMQKLLQKGAEAQGRMEAEGIQEQLAIQRGIPLTQIRTGKEKGKRQKGEATPKTLLGLDYKTAEGHVIVVAPHRAGKGLHLTETLLHYPGPALIVDPKGEQFARTAALRRHLGPIYRLPGHQVHLAGYYRKLCDRDEAIELHYHLLRPWASGEPIFAEKALSLFTAVGLYTRPRQLNPIRLLLDLAESNPVEALTALRQDEDARRHVDIFTNGAAPGEYRDDKFVTSALGNFTTRLASYQKHIDTVAPPDLARRDLIVPPDWAGRNGTIYLTYSLTDLRAAGGVMAATLAALLRYQMRSGRGRKMLVAIDELSALGLRNIVDYLATIGGYGITMLLYIQSVAQLQEIYGRDGLRAILSNCAHQLWYPAAELETARFMSDLYGTTLKATPMQSASESSRRQQDRDGQSRLQTTHNQGASWSWRDAAVLTPNEMMALPPEQVLATTRAAGRQVVYLGERLNPVALFDRLPSPDRLGIPKPIWGPRVYTDWRALAAAPAGGVGAEGQETSREPEADSTRRMR